MILGCPGLLHGDALLAARELMKCMFSDFCSLKISHFRLKLDNRFLLIKFHSPVQKLDDGRPLVSVAYLDSRYGRIQHIPETTYCCCSCY
jgi:hypothetical protein